MEDLYEALSIFIKYSKEKYPSWCEHDTLHIRVSPSIVSDEDILRLDELGFFVPEYEEDEFISFRYGSC